MADWGITAVLTDTALGSVCRAMGNTFGSTAWTLNSVSVHNPNSHSLGMRIGVWTGGALDDLEGATLLEDLGVLTGGGGVGWDTINSTSNPTVPADTIVWIMLKADEGTSIHVSTSTSSGDAGDFQTARGRANLTVSTPAAGTAWDPSNPGDPVPASATAFGNIWYSIYLSGTPQGVSGPPDHHGPGGFGRAFSRGLRRSMEKINGLWQPTGPLIIPVGIDLAGAR